MATATRKKVVKEKRNKKYESLTPPWAKLWLKKYLLPTEVRKLRDEAAAKVAKAKDLSVKEEPDRKKRSRELGRFKSRFPFMIFQDELIVEEKRVVWINRMGPWMSRAISIMATDISNVQASHGPLFGHLHVGSLVGGPEVLIEKLSRKDCLQARALIEGIILSAREGLKVKKKAVEAEKEELSQMGKVKF